MQKDVEFPKMLSHLAPPIGYLTYPGASRCVPCGPMDTRDLSFPHHAAVTCRFATTDRMERRAQQPTVMVNSNVR